MPRTRGNRWFSAIFRTTSLHPPSTRFRCSDSRGLTSPPKCDTLHPQILRKNLFFAQRRPVVANGIDVEESQPAKQGSKSPLGTPQPISNIENEVLDLLFTELIRRDHAVGRQLVNRANIRHPGSFRQSSLLKILNHPFPKFWHRVMLSSWGEQRNPATTAGNTNVSHDRISTCSHLKYHTTFTNRPPPAKQAFRPVIRKNCQVLDIA